MTVLWEKKISCLSHYTQGTTPVTCEYWVKGNTKEEYLIKEQAVAY